MCLDLILPFDNLISSQAGGILWIDYRQVIKLGSGHDLTIQNTYVLPPYPFSFRNKRPFAESGYQVDRWLYGHPDQKRFDSPNRFYPHFKYLMQHGNGEACQCDLCGSKGRTRGPSKSTARPQAATKRPTQPAPLNRGPVDEEGTPDVYCSLFTLLKNEGTLSRTIEERASLVCFISSTLSVLCLNRFLAGLACREASGPEVCQCHPKATGLHTP